MSMRLLSAVLVFLFLGCNATKPAGDGGQKDEEREFRPPPLASQLPPGALHRTSRPDSFGDLLDDLAKADLVYVGEDPDDAGDHLLQLRVIEYLFDRGRLQGIGMEMFPRAAQPALDDYVEGRIDEAELVERSGWDTAWPHDFALYRPILEYARKTRLPVLALAVDPDILAAVAGGGLDALSPAQRAALPATSPATLSDDVMADGIVGWFRSSPKNGQLVVLAATGRVAPRDRLPGIVHGRNGKAYRTVVPVAADAPAGSYARTYADYLWVAEAP